MDPSQNSDPSVTYSLEVDRAGCSKDPQINLTYDERYINTGSIGISEWAMQDDSDVLDELIALPHYADQVGRDYHAKKQAKMYNLWVRPTIPYQLQCESSVPRQTVANILNGHYLTKDASLKGDHTVKRLCWVMIIFTPIFLILAIYFEWYNKQWVSLVVVFTTLVVC